MKSFYVIDGHALCYRAYFAFIKNPLINSSGQNTSAIFGFARMVLQLISERQPDLIAVAFDPPGRSFRFDMYQEYKANRQKMPDDLRSQIEEIKELVKILGIPVLMSEGFEADDVLGTIAENYKSNYEIFLVTGDKDAYQLVDDSVKIYANSKGVSEFMIYDADAVTEKLGVTPSQVIDYMAIVGDTSDNVPGVKGIGPKGAAKLIQTYENLDAVYESIEMLKGKQKDQLLEDKENAYLSRDLVTIKTDVPINFDPVKAEFKGFNINECAAYFEKLEMTSIVSDFFSEGDTKKSTKYDKDSVDYRLVLTKEELIEAVKTISQYEIIAVDTETTSVHPVEADLVGISVSHNEGAGFYFAASNASLFDTKGPEYTKEELIAALRPPFENSSIKKVGQNIKYDIIVLANVGINLAGVFFDTMIASYVLDPSGRKHNMDDLALNFLGYTTIHYEELVGKGKSQISITDVPLETLCAYAVEDTDITFRLFNVFSKQLNQNEKLKKLFHEIEMPLVHVLGVMEMNGVTIDRDYFNELSQKNSEELLKVEEDIYTIAGIKFNINSTKELSQLLFEKLGLDPVKKTKTGFSTDISVLEALKTKHAIIPRLISYRTLSKLKNTYIDVLPTLVFSKSGRIHTSYNQTVAATGRLSSTDPNLQNIPVKDEFGKHIRNGFIAPDGYYVLSADYSQIELRLAAHISGDENMKKAFVDGIDIHTLTASNVYNVSTDNVTSVMRRQAKIINFSTIYGVSPYGLSRQSDVSMADAKDFIDKYFETYPGFKDYINSTIEFCRTNGYVETLMGRRRYLPEINSKTSFRREGAERIAINTPIQGSSADLIKIAMINIQNFIEQNKLQSKLIMQVHDELVFEIHNEENDFESVITEMMSSAMKLDVPLIVEAGRGKSWEEAH
jgi:DNA polymerase-1